jgi:hypothetical protein
MITYRSGNVMLGIESNQLSRLNQLSTIYHLLSVK